MSQAQPALFLDRDGVVIQWVDYISDPKLVVLKPGLLQILRRARQQNWKLVIVTNQSGIGRGKFSLQDYESVQARISELLKKEHLHLDAVYMSPYFAEGTNEHSQLGKELRKPKPGMFFAAAKDMNIDLTKSIMIGDSATDLEAAFAAGVPHRFFLHYPQTPMEQQRQQAELAKLDKAWSVKVVQSFDEIKI